MRVLRGNEAIEGRSHIIFRCRNGWLDRQRDISSDTHAIKRRRRERDCNRFHLPRHLPAYRVPFSSMAWARSIGGLRIAE